MLFSAFLRFLSDECPRDERRFPTGLPRTKAKNLVRVP